MKSFSLVEDIELCNDLMLGIVMKMGDKHLRIIVKRLEALRKADKEWVFWSATGRLAKVLKSIFLPCYNVEAAVQVLSTFKEGKKRGREEDDVIGLVLDGVDHVLKADGFGGGDWCQAEDGRRYNMLLSELGRLLVKGGEGAGGAAGRCLVSLAAAGGGDIMWKPLNFVVLEACGEDDRAVRKRGVKCLKEIFEVVREEYMGLVAECLPTISELLEDDDTEIKELAKLCLNIAEEMTGEDLKEHL